MQVIVFRELFFKYLSLIVEDIINENFLFQGIRPFREIPRLHGEGSENWGMF